MLFLVTGICRCCTVIGQWEKLAEWNVLGWTGNYAAIAQIPFIAARNPAITEIKKTRQTLKLMFI